MTGDPNVRLVVKTGEALGAYFQRRAFQGDELTRALAELLINPAERLQRRLIRRVGLFHIDAERPVQFYYYDGRDAYSQIRALVLGAIRTVADRHSIDRVYVESSRSGWFGDPARGALKDAGVDKKSVHELRIGSTTTTKIRVSAGYTLVILPIVRSGDSLRRLLGTLRSDAELEKVIVWALLSVDGDRATYGDRLLSLDALHSTPRSLKVAYALRVPAEPKNLHPSWRNAKDLAIDPRGASLAGQFPADEMWGMIFESGLNPEDPIPTHRESLGLVPNYGDIVVRNGPLIAARISAILEETFKSKLPPTIPFLLPREPNAEELARCVSERERNQTILISRDIVSAARGVKHKTEIRNAVEKLNKPALVAEYDALTRRLDYLSSWKTNYPDREVPRAVLMDEFEYSGQTLTDLLSIAIAFGLDVLCAMCLGNLGDSKPAALPIRILPLYHLNYARLQ